jgi:hypothetical protein
LRQSALAAGHSGLSGGGPAVSLAKGFASNSDTHSATTRRGLHLLREKKLWKILIAAK